jgi:hypothetical protein
MKETYLAQVGLDSVQVTACMRRTDHVALNFNNKMSMAVVFLDIEKAFDTTGFAVLNHLNRIFNPFN